VIVPETRTVESEMAALRARLAEAEDMHRAISVGEVDAFVVGPSDEDKQVLLLATAYSRYRQVLEGTEHGTVTVDAQGEIVLANASFARMAGCGVGELARTRLADYVHPADRAALTALLTSPHASQLELRLVRPTGAQLHARVTVASVSEGHATLLVSDLSGALAADEARETLEAIRHGEVDAFVMGETVITLGAVQDPYRLLADRIQQGALTLSPGGGIVYANVRLARMLGVAPERLLGMPFAGYVAPDDRAELGKVLAGRQARESHAEVRLVRATGERLPVLVSAATLADGHHMCLVTDLAETKRHKASDERMRTFLGMLAHEFRNMLNGMSLSLELLKREKDPDECARAVASLERQMKRMLQIVDDLRSINPRD
jgi:PAS domain S-box-containing protein